MKGRGRTLVGLVFAAAIASAAPSSGPPALGDPPQGAAVRFVSKLPPLPAPEKAKLSLLGAVCPLALRTTRKHPEIGCRECYSPGASPHLDGRVALDPKTFYGVDAVVPGSFTAAGAKEVAVSLEGCESHAENWGGLLVLRLDGEKARAVEYFSGVHPHACKKYRKKDGRDLLVCSRTDGHQATFHDFLSSFDAARAAAAEDVEAGWDQLLETEDITGGACWSVNEPDAEPVTQSKLTSFKFRDLNGDGMPDLVAEVTHFREQSRAATVAHCKAAEKAEENETPMPPLPMRRIRKDAVQFLFDGERFVPRKK